MDIEPLSPDDTPLDSFRKTGRNLAAHAVNGLRGVASAMVGANPVGLAVGGYVTPTEDFAQELLPVPLISRYQPGSNIVGDMALRAAGIGNRALRGIPVVASRAAGMVGDFYDKVTAPRPQPFQYTLRSPAEAHGASVGQVINGAMPTYQPQDEEQLGLHRTIQNAGPGFVRG